MLKPIFFYYQDTFYNVNQIVKFETKKTTHFITMSNGEKLEVNTGLVNFKEILSVINPPYDEGYSKT